MNWLSTRRTKRRKTQAGAVFVALGLIAGILGIAPAFADPADGVQCWAVRNSDDSLDFWWSGVPAANAPDVEIAWFDAAGNAVASRQVPDAVFGHVLLPFTETHPELATVGIWWQAGVDDVACQGGTFGPPPGDLQPPTFGARCSSGVIEMEVQNQGSSVDLTIDMSVQDGQGNWIPWTGGTNPATHQASAQSTTSFGVPWQDVTFPFQMHITGQDEAGGYQLDSTHEWAFNPCESSWGEPSISVDCQAGQVHFTALNNGPDSDVLLIVTEEGANQSETVDFGLIPHGESAVVSWALADLELPTNFIFFTNDPFEQLWEYDLTVAGSGCTSSFDLVDFSVTCTTGDPILSITVENVSNFDGSVTYNGTQISIAAGQTADIAVNPGETTITVTWIDDNGDLQEIGYDFTGDIDEECNGDLTVTYDVDCNSDEFVVELTAPAGAVTVFWSVNDGDSQTGLISNGASIQVTLGEGDVVHIEANGTVLDDVSYDDEYQASCAADLSAEIGPLDCSAVPPTTSIILSNTGNIDSTVSVAYDGTNTDYDVAADSDITLSGFEAIGTVTVTEVGGETLLTVNLENLFEECSPDTTWTFTPNCATGVTTITVSSTNDFPVEVTIEVGGGAPISYTVPANANNVIVDISAVIDDTIVISIGDIEIENYVPNVVCPFDIVIDVNVDCASNTANIMVSNNHPINDVTVTVNSNLLVDPATGIGISAGGGTYELELSLDQLPAGDTSVWATADPVGGEPSDQVDASVAVDCGAPTPNIWVDAQVVCSDPPVPGVATLNVTVGNNGDAATTVTISAAVSNDPAQTVTVPAGEPGLTFAFTVDADQAVILSVSGDEIDDISQTLTADCGDEEPPAPILSAWLACNTTHVIGEWTNTGNATGLVAITVDGNVIEEWTMVPGTPSATQPYAADRLASPYIGTHDVAVIAQPAGTVLASTIVSDEICDAIPNASFTGSIAGVCDAPQGVNVTVSNTGAVADDVQLTLNGSVQNLGPVDPGVTSTFFVPVAGNGTVHASLSYNGDSLAALSWDDFCVNPSAELLATIAVSCAANEITIDIENTGDAIGIAIVTVDGVSSDPIAIPAATIMPGAFGPIVAGQAYHVVVTGPTPEVNETVDTSQCVGQTPDLTAETQIDCAASEARIIIQNLGAVAGTASWTVNGVDSAALIQPGEVRIETVPLTLGMAMEITVTTNGGVLTTVSEADLCVQDEPSLSANTTIICTASSITVTVHNSGLASGDATILVGGEERTVTVPAVGSVNEAFVIAEDQLFTVTVTANGAASALLTETQTMNCFGPSSAASVSLSCTTSLVTYILNNNDAVPRTFVVEVLGKPDETIVLDAATSHTGYVSVKNGDGYEVVVKRDAQVLASAAGTVNCGGPIVPMVQGKLARTGVNTSAMFIAAATLIVAGGFFVSAARTREQAAIKVSPPQRESRF